MNNSKPDGGLAFPSPTHRGMNLRTWLAGRAMQGITSRTEGMIVGNYAAIAEMAVKLADALIAELQEDPDRSTEHQQSVPDASK